MYRCSDYGGRDNSVTAGTVLQRPDMPFTVGFEAAWLMMGSKQGVSVTCGTAEGWSSWDQCAGLQLEKLVFTLEDAVPGDPEKRRVLASAAATMRGGHEETP